jgi:hypothetical protein
MATATKSRKSARPYIAKHYYADISTLESHEGEVTDFKAEERSEHTGGPCLNERRVKRTFIPLDAAERFVPALIRWEVKF